MTYYSSRIKGQQSPYVSILLVYLLYLPKDLAKKKKITMVKPFARSSGMDILKYSRLPRATPSRWARRIPIRRILFNYLNRLRKKLISALIYFISFFSLLPTRSPRNQASAAAPPPSCRQRRAVTLPPPLQHSRCCNRATTVTLFTAATLRAAATAADAAAAAVPPPSFRRRRAVGLPPPPTSRCRHRRSIRAAATALPPSRCAPPPCFAMPPPPLMLPPPPCHRQASADVALSRCRHRRGIRAAATALPPSRCALPPRFALPPPPLTLPPPPCHRQAAADVALSR